MKTFYPYDPTNPVAVEGEAHKIIHGQIRLDHVPLESSIEVRGFRPAQSAANLQSNEFFCSYRADTLYREANRIVYFWAGRSGQQVYVSYQAVASPITADDMNEIGKHLTDSDKRLDAQDSATNEIRNSVVAAREEARKTLTAHNADANAHDDIRNKIDAEGAMRIAADASLQQQLNVVRNAFDIVSAAVDELTDTVETLTTNVAQLQSQLTDEINTRGQLSETVSQLNSRLEDEINLRAQLAVKVDKLQGQVTAEIGTREQLSETVSQLQSQLADEIDTREQLAAKVTELQAQINAETLARLTLENSLNERITFNVDEETFYNHVFGDTELDIISIFDPKPTDNDQLSDDEIAYIFDDESPVGDVTDDEINDIFTD